MARFAAKPMDVAATTLLLLAERLDTPNTLTPDEHGLRTCRIAGQHHCQLVLLDA